MAVAVVVAATAAYSWTAGKAQPGSSTTWPAGTGDYTISICAVYGCCGCPTTTQTIYVAFHSCCMRLQAHDAFDGTTDGFYDAYDDQESTEFTWNVGAGVSYAINKQISLVGEYQYVSFGDASTGQDSFTDGFRVEDAAAHEVQLGLKYNF